jgi:SAM-dependent methyltransferase
MLAAALKARAHHAWESAMEQNMESIATLAKGLPEPRLLDLGCDAGGRTSWVAQRIGASEMHGVELAADRAALATEKGVKVISADLCEPLPYDADSFDVVMSNQVIEHLADTDTFVREIHRILRPGGIAVVSTENLAAWHNVVSLVFGWLPFSLTNISEVRRGIGNPLGLHRGEPGEPRGHLRVLTLRGLRELFEIHGLHVDTVVGAGYFPLPRAVARLDPRHAVFLTIRARKLT